MRLRFRSVAEARPGANWKTLFDRSWPSYRRWFLSEGAAARADLPTCREKLARHMPELEPLWEELVRVAGGGDEVARMLSLVNPPPYITGCSQAVWSRESPFLVRNYDYHPDKCEGTFTMTCWTGTRVIASSDCLWGVLDGMNEHGLSVALSFGGRKVVGDGFGIPLILRYVLETCSRTGQAVDALVRIPSHMAYNISLLDASGEHFVVSVAPGRPPLVVATPIATNHQNTPEWSHYEQFSRSEEREKHLAWLLADPAMDGKTLTDAFLEPPLYNVAYSRGFGTLYTARYEPGTRRATYLWPGETWVRSFDSFDRDELVVEYDEPESGR